MRVRRWRSWAATLIPCSLLMASCGYHWHPDFPLGHRPSLAVAFIPEDEDASLTHEMARALSASGLVNIVRMADADYRLEISFVEAKTETIGYRFKPQKINSKVSQNLVSTEGRRSVTVEARFHKGDVVAYGPYQITADADYDFLDGDSIQDLAFFDAAGRSVTVLPFSLGQLEPNEAAQTAATRPLYARLARKLVDVLAMEW